MSERGAVQSEMRVRRYKVVQEDEGRGMDVTLLHHDVGLVCTRAHMALRTRLLADPVAAMRRYNAFELHNEEVEVRAPSTIPRPS